MAFQLYLFMMSQIVMYFCKKFNSFYTFACVFLLIDVQFNNGNISINIIEDNIFHYNINFKAKSPQSQAPSLIYLASLFLKNR
jgi:hypothetical protein